MVRLFLRRFRPAEGPRNRSTDPTPARNLSPRHFPLLSIPRPPFPINYPAWLCSDDETGGPRRAPVPPMGNTPGSSQDPQECKQQVSLTYGYARKIDPPADLATRQCSKHFPVLVPFASLHHVFPLPRQGPCFLLPLHSLHALLSRTSSRVPPSSPQLGRSINTGSHDLENSAYSASPPLRTRGKG